MRDSALKNVKTIKPRLICAQPLPWFAERTLLLALGSAFGQQSFRRADWIGGLHVGTPSPVASPKLRLLSRKQAPTTGRVLSIFVLRSRASKTAKKKMLQAGFEPTHLSIAE